MVEFYNLLFVFHRLPHLLPHLAQTRWSFAFSDHKRICKICSASLLIYQESNSNVLHAKHFNLTAVVVGTIPTCMILSMQLCMMGFFSVFTFTCPSGCSVYWALHWVVSYPLFDPCIARCFFQGKGWNSEERLEGTLRRAPEGDGTLRRDWRRVWKYNELLSPASPAARSLTQIFAINLKEIEKNISITDELHPFSCVTVPSVQLKRTRFGHL